MGSTVIKQHVWGHTYTDELLQIGNTDDLGDSVVETFYWPCQDANYNVTELYESDGDLAERYIYSPYGRRTAFKPDSSDTFGTYPIQQG